MHDREREELHAEFHSHSILFYISISRVEHLASLVEAARARSIGLPSSAVWPAGSGLFMLIWDYY
jgi:hypothetical protein